MEEIGKRRAVIVGVFVFLGLVIFIAAVFMMGKKTQLFSNNLHVSAVFKDVKGLAAGRNVQYSGVKVGTVKKIRFLRANEIQVDMNIDRSATPYLHKDVVATVSSEGLMGNKMIQLTGGSTNMPLIEDGDTLNVGSGLSTDEIMSTLQTNNKSLVTITDNLKVITKRMVDGQGSMGKILTDDAVYDNLNSAVAGLKVTATNTQRLTDALALYASKLHTKGALANDLVTDTTIFANLRRASNDINTMVEQANIAVAELQAASEGVRTGLADQQATAGMILHDTLFADALKATMLNLQASTEKLDTNMLALRSNFFFRGFFRRQAEREQKEQKAREKAARKAARKARR
ncbi:MCE family protein [Chitinophaga silvatica]|uniref:MCE family protein n=1 Tax=Chitinophaga silvatica TaxID=2282649 RepID=A0A3E1Y6M0_9BACT|nr:MlaD family protein [Chitinophaga silvatica]RFS20207.1 MCE family protein [Chitinophaga silvatica]